MKIVLVRHPPPEIGPGICYGRLDMPLTASSAEIDRLGGDPAFAGVAHVWSSPARRCRQLAEAIVCARGIPVCFEPRLQELDFGAWEGLPWAEIARSELDRWAESPLEFAPPGGESGAALIGRVEEFHADFLARGQDCAIVSHGGPLKVLDALLNGSSPDLLAPAPPMGSIRIVNC